MNILTDDRKEKIRFLVTGGWNTLFGYFSFILLYSLFASAVHYMLLVVISNLLSITNAYISYKTFVFKTKGNFLKEYSRFYVVYGASFLASLILMPALIELLHIHPYLAQAIMITFTVIISYFGHKSFSFKV